MNKFTFGVLTYNQEQLIVQTLESIKYQIKMYASDIVCKLIVIDDCSTDQTVKVVLDWSSNNKNLFDCVNIHTNEYNKGTVYNFNYILNQIKDENFKVIAGDDLIASQNLFSAYNGLNNQRIYSFFPLYLIDGEIVYDKQRLYKFYGATKLHNRRKIMAQFMKGGFLHTPSTIYQKSVYIKARCEQFNSKFRLFEDDPTWYTMLKNIDELELIFILDSIVLYRMHEASVSNSHKKNNPFDKELKQLWEIYEKEAKGYQKLYWWFRNRDTLPKVLRLDQYVDKVSFLFQKSMLNYDNNFAEFKEKIETIIQREQLFYDTILTVIQEHSDM